MPRPENKEFKKRVLQLIKLYYKQYEIAIDVSRTQSYISQYFKRHGLEIRKR